MKIKHLAHTDFDAFALARLVRSECAAAEGDQ